MKKTLVLAAITILLTVFGCGKAKKPSTESSNAGDSRSGAPGGSTAGSSNSQESKAPTKDEFRTAFLDYYASNIKVVKVADVVIDSVSEPTDAPAPYADKDHWAFTVTWTGKELQDSGQRRFKHSNEIAIITPFEGKWLMTGRIDAFNSRDADTKAWLEKHHQPAPDMKAVE
jgi:hypothetical protein